MEDKVPSAQATQAARPRIGFHIHLAVFVLVNAALAAINLLTSPEHLWFQWPLIGWGLGILFHVGLLFYLPKQTEGMQHRIAPELKKKGRNRRRSHTN